VARARCVTFRRGGRFLLTKGKRKAKGVASVKVSGNDWQIVFDAFLLEDVAKATGIDLADIAAGGWLQIETDSGALGRALAAVCRDEIKARNWTPAQFVKGVRGAVIVAARDALREEAADFFPPSEWSAIRSNLAQRTSAREQAAGIQAAMAAMEGMSPDFRAGAMEALREAMAGAAMDGINSQRSTANPSASGPVGILSESVIDEPENAE
jgi:hypothetical protein